MPTVTLFGPVDSLVGDNIEYVLLGVIVLNMVTRVLAHRTHVDQANDGGAEALSRFIPHVATNVLLVLGAFYYLTLEQHAGMVTAILVLGLFITDFFEFEARKVEARRDVDIDLPNGAIAASLLTFGYIAYQSLFFLLAPAWNAVI